MAKVVIENAQWGNKFSSSFQDDLAKLMVPFDAPEGHIFIKEGEPINAFLMVESGLLSRTKRPSGEDHEDDEPIQIDMIGPGRASGFLHVAGSQSEEVAFATVAAGKGGAKVWVVSGGHFRKLCEENPKVIIIRLDPWMRFSIQCTQSSNTAVFATPTQHSAEVIKVSSAFCLTY